VTAANFCLEVNYEFTQFMKIFRQFAVTEGMRWYFFRRTPPKREKLCCLRRRSTKRFSCHGDFYNSSVASNEIQKEVS